MKALHRTLNVSLIEQTARYTLIEHIHTLQHTLRMHAHTTRTTAHTVFTWLNAAPQIVAAFE